ncbi:MAG: transglutaminase domain-containing protein [Verrucomicrobiales bacterium]
MQIKITHSSVYKYEKAVSFSPHYLRIFPRSHKALRWESVHFTTQPEADIQYRRDLYDNEFALCFFPGTESHHLGFYAEFVMELEEVNPFHFLVAPHAVNLPFSYSEEEQRILAPARVISREDAGLVLPFWDYPSEPASTVDTLVSLCDALNKQLKYERREQGRARSPQETIAAGSGACRDTAVLLAAVLRRLGLAARLASGYLCEFGDSVHHERRAEGAFHAWTETYLPGAGWIGLDGTNGVLCDHSYICTAVGYTPDDITPIVGSYYANEQVPSTMTSTLDIEQKAKNQP